MTALLNAATTDTTGTGVATTARDAWIEIPADSVFDGAIVTIQMASVNSSAKYSSAAVIGTITSPGWVYMVFPVGTFIRARLHNAKSQTNVTVNLLE